MHIVSANLLEGPSGRQVSMPKIWALRIVKHFRFAHPSSIPCKQLVDRVHVSHFGVAPSRTEAEECQKAAGRIGGQNPGWR